MTEAELIHFLLIADPAKPQAEVRNLGTDYDAAIRAYNEAEADHRDDAVEVVLLSADSLDTIRRTHSSYFTSSTINAIETAIAAGAS